MPLYYAAAFTPIRHAFRRAITRALRRHMLRRYAAYVIMLLLLRMPTLPLFMLPLICFCRAMLVVAIRLRRRYAPYAATPPLFMRVCGGESLLDIFRHAAFRRCCHTFARCYTRYGLLFASMPCRYAVSYRAADVALRHAIIRHTPTLLPLVYAMLPFTLCRRFDTPPPFFFFAPRFHASNGYFSSCHMMPLLIAARFECHAATRAVIVRVVTARAPDDAMLLIYFIAAGARWRLLRRRRAIVWPYCR